MKQEEKFLTLKRKLVKTGSSKGVVIPVEILKLVKVNKNGEIEFKVKLK